MSERKNIDKLFQEKFKDFEVEPAAEVWQGIEAKLKEKKKDRKVIPFWWKLSGVAAALLIGFAVTDGYHNRNTKIKNNTVVDGNTPHNGNGNNVSPVDSASKNNNAVVNVENPSTVKEDSNDHNSNSTASNNPNEIITSKKENNTQLVVNENNDSGKSHRKAKRNHSGGISNASNSNNFETTENRLAQNASHKKSKGKFTNTNPSFHKNDPLQNDVQNSQQTNTNNKSYINESNPVAVSQNKTNSEPDSTTAKTISPDNTASPMVTADNKKLDSTAIATVVPNALEELLNEKENNLVTKEPHLNRWQITSSVAPIYFGSTSKGSPIDSTFAGNSKDYKNNLSVSLGVNYIINKKFSIRTGISQVTFNYNTNDVYISAGMQGGPLKNVTTSPESQFLNFGKRPSGTNLTAGSSPELLSTDTFQSYINQKMGYIEVPLELTYSLYDKRFGINIIGGVSTLFLNENKIVVVSEGMKSTLGEANNLNKTHFSSNIGLGVKYKIYKAFQANFEPMFKYQINTFSKDDGNFKPYYFGLYTGLSYSF